MLDVLGMKSWLSSATAQSVAESLDESLAACDQASMGDTRAGEVYGPIIGTTHFSDSILMWAPDDSWSSLFVICNAVKMVVGAALDHGIPLRGAIAVGETVCRPSTLRFVGAPIEEAFIWAEKKDREYRSVGISITPETVEMLGKKLASEPIPDHYKNWPLGLDEAVIARTKTWSGLLMWHADSLFVNHWAHGTFVDANVKEMFLKRNLKTASDEDEVCKKIEAMAAFFEDSRHHQQAESSVPIGAAVREKYRCAREEEFLRLNRLKQERDYPTK